MLRLRFLFLNSGRVPSSRNGFRVEGFGIKVWICELPACGI